MAHSIVDLAAQRLALPLPGLALQTATLGALARLGRDTLSGGVDHALYQGSQALQRIRSVLLPGAMLLGLDDDHTLRGDAFVPPAEEPLLVKFR